jgi:hypothetical protein
MKNIQNSSRVVQKIYQRLINRKYRNLHLLVPDKIYHPEVKKNPTGIL